MVLGFLGRFQPACAVLVSNERESWRESFSRQGKLTWSKPWSGVPFCSHRSFSPVGLWVLVFVTR